MVAQPVMMPGRPPFFAAPKSDAGKRLVAIPSMILPDVLSHLDGLTVPGADTLLFSSPTGKPLRHTNSRRRVWLPALAASGLDVHFHDLCHTGNQLVAEAGPTSANSWTGWAIRPAAQRSSTCIPQANVSTPSLTRWPPACSPNLAKPGRALGDDVARQADRLRRRTPIGRALAL
jgi:hypothetical protein